MSVEEFIYCLLDPINGPNWSVESFGDYCLDDILDDAIGYEQKKVILNDNSIVFPGAQLLHLAGEL